MSQEQLTKHFTRKEVECKCGCGMLPDPAFLVKLEALRVWWGRPMVINSGARCPEYNAKLKGASHKSYHMRGRAADVAIGLGMDRYDFVRLAMKEGFTGIGVGKDFIHIDNRDIPAMWSY